MRRNTHKTKLQTSKKRMAELRKRRKNAKKAAEIKKAADERAKKVYEITRARHEEHMNAIAKKWLKMNSPEGPDAA